VVDSHGTSDPAISDKKRVETESLSHRTTKSKENEATMETLKAT